MLIDEGLDAWEGGRERGRGEGVSRQRGEQVLLKMVGCQERWYLLLPCLLFFFQSLSCIAPLTLFLCILNPLEIPAMLGFVHLGQGYPDNTPAPEQLLELLWLINQASLVFYISLLIILRNTSSNENER